MRITTESLVWRLVRNAWRIVGPKTRTHLLADSFADWFYGDVRLAAVPPLVRFVFNAANLTSGVRFTLEREVVGDYVLGYVPTETTSLRLAEAVAVSAALPGAFAPFVLRGLGLPCERDRTPKLVDGGAYDNMGLEAIDDLAGGELMLGLNAGGVFRTGTRFGRIPLIRDLSRSNSLLYRQSTGRRRSELVERFRAWEDARGQRVEPPAWARRGVLFGLSTTFQQSAPEWSSTRDPREDLRVRGWWLSGAALSTFHREVLPERLPEWRQPPVVTADSPVGAGDHPHPSVMEHVRRLSWLVCPAARFLTLAKVEPIIPMLRRSHEGVDRWETSTAADSSQGSP